MTLINAFRGFRPYLQNADESAFCQVHKVSCVTPGLG